MLAYLLMLVLSSSHVTAVPGPGVGTLTSHLAGSLGATPSGATLAACGAYRNQNAPTPKWWTRVRPIVYRHLAAFPPGISVSFLGAWIERETDGRHAIRSRSNEVGYFQLHPLEIEAMVGKSKVAAAMADIVSSRDASMRWGARYLSGYDKVITGLGVKRGTETYYGLMKAMHWDPTKTPRWIRLVKHAAGSIPSSYQGFILVADQVRKGVLPRAPGVSLPGSMPSCSSFFVLDRSKWFPARSRIGRAVLGVGIASLAVAGSYFAYTRWVR